jgi:hypothetical protein
MAYIDPAAAPKYGPTPYYGRCEVHKCTAKARVTCPRCGGQHCLSHAGHEEHRDSGTD